jgi:hypothetical protein
MTVSLKLKSCRADFLGRKREERRATVFTGAFAQGLAAVAQVNGDQLVIRQRCPLLLTQSRLACRLCPVLFN